MKSPTNFLRYVAGLCAILALVLLPIEAEANGPDKISWAHGLMTGDQKENLIVAGNTTEEQVSQPDLRLQATPQGMMIIPGSSFSPAWDRWLNSKQGCHHFACELSDDGSILISGIPDDDIHIPLGRDNDQLLLRLPDQGERFNLKISQDLDKNLLTLDVVGSVDVTSIKFDGTVALNLHSANSDRLALGSLTAAALSVSAQQADRLVFNGPVQVKRDLKITGDSTIIVNAPISTAGGFVSASQTFHVGPTGAIEITGGDATIHTTKMLSLRASRLDISGDLTLWSEQTINLRDNTGQPLMVEAQANLHLQGDQTIDILALRHPDSVLISGGDMTLQSANAVRGDIHYVTGGKFEIGEPDGQPGDLVSPYDPIVFANGDVTLGDYTGASLHILAGGSVELSNVEITGPDTGPNSINPGNTNPFNGVDTIASLAGVTLSNGTGDAIDGSITPTLDIRAGIDWTTFAGGAPANQVIPPVAVTPSFGGAATSADIMVSGNITISVPAGQVLLTNQYRPNGLTGDITTGNIDASTTQPQTNGGSIVIDSHGDITTGHLFTFAEVLGTLVTAGDGGNIGLLAPNGTIVTNGNLSAYTRTPGNNSGPVGNGGSISMAAFSDITIDNGLGQISSFASSNSDGSAGDGGSILIESANGNIQSGPLQAHTFAADDVAGTGGTITINTTGGGVTIASNIFQESVQTFALSNSGAGDGGPVVISATEGITVAKGIFAYSNGSNSNGGDVSLITTGGPIAAEDFVTRATHPNLIGDGGNVTLRALSGDITAGNIDAYSRASGLFGMASNGGQVTLEAGGGDIESGTVNSHAFANGDDSVAGNGGSITFTANGEISSGPLTAYSLSADNNFLSGIAGNGGSVRLQATQNISIAGNIQTFSQADTDGFAQNGGTIAITSTTGLIDTGGNLMAYSKSMSHTLSAGDISLMAATGILVDNGSGIVDASATSFDGSVGSGGQVTINTASGNLVLQRVDSLARTSSDSLIGNGGDISLTTGNGHIQITGTPPPFVSPVLNSYVSTFGSSGAAGNVTMGATQGITLAASLNAYGIGTEADGGDVVLITSGGNITTTEVRAYVQNGNNAGSDGGNITLQAPNGGITSGEISSYSDASSINNPTGDGGNITISAGNGDVVSGLLDAHSEARGEFGHTGDAGQVIVMASNGGIFIDGDVRADAFSVDNNTNSGNAGNGQGIILQATQDISVTGGLQSFARSSTFFGLPTPTGTAGNAGPVTLTATNISLSYIDARSIATGTIGSGGTVQVTAGQFFQATGNLFGSASTIDATGLAGSGAITITHGGNGITPFVVGNAATNGITGTLSTADATIAPTNSYLYSHFEPPNIWILSVPFPLEISKTANPSGAAPYQGQITYTVTISSFGTTDANNVVFTDTLPAEVSFDQFIAQPGGAIVTPGPPDQIRWTGPVPGSGIAVFSYVVNHVGDYSDVFSNTAEFLYPTGVSDGSASAQVSIAGPPVLSISKSATPDTNAPYQGQITYSVVVSNAGPSDAVDTVFSDILPVEVSFDQFIEQPGGANVIPGPPDQIAWTGTITAGEAVTFTFVANHVGDYSDVFTNTSSFFYPTTETDGSASAQVSIAGPPILTISKTANPNTDVVYQGEVTYTVVISNSGQSEANDTSLTDLLPGEVDFARWIEQPPGANVNVDEITWTGPVPGNEAVTFTFVVTHMGDYSDVFTNTSSFFYPATETDGSASAQVSIADPPLLLISKTATPNVEVTYQGEVTYTIVISNDEASDAVETLLTDTLPLSTTFARWVEQPPGANINLDEITWTGPVPANDAVIFTFVVSHTGDYEETVLNSAQYSQADNQGSAEAAFTVQPHSTDLLISKSSLRDNEAGLITYSVIAQNLGPTEAGGTVISDPIPPGINGFTWQCTATGGASCTANGVGSINDTLANFPVGSQVVYSITATMVSTDVTVVNEATLLPPLGVTNTAPTNSAIDISRPLQRTFLPLVIKDFLSAPDLVVDSLSAGQNAVTMTIKNVGNATVIDGFWVDVYLNPATPPTHVNQHWHNLGDQGLVWGVVAPNIAPGQTITLTLDHPAYRPDLSNFVMPLPVGSSVYAQVDSVNLLTNYGGVLELHEITGGPYNNIAQTISTAALANQAALSPSEQPETTNHGLPPR